MHYMKSRFMGLATDRRNDSKDSLTGQAASSVKAELDRHTKRILFSFEFRRQRRQPPREPTPRKRLVVEGAVAGAARDRGKQNVALAIYRNVQANHTLLAVPTCRDRLLLELLQSLHGGKLPHAHGIQK